MHGKGALVVSLEGDAVVASRLAATLPHATLGECADEPRLFAGWAPRPVFLEVVLSRLDPASADPDHQPDHAVQDSVDEQPACGS